MNGLERAIAIFETKAALARATKRFPQEINRWLKAGVVPMRHCHSFVVAIDEELPRAHQRGISTDVATRVTCHDLNPLFPVSEQLEEGGSTVQRFSISS